MIDKPILWHSSHETYFRNLSATIVACDFFLLAQTIKLAWSSQASTLFQCVFFKKKTIERERKNEKFSFSHKFNFFIKSAKFQIVFLENFLNKLTSKFVNLSYLKNYPRRIINRCISTMVLSKKCVFINKKNVLINLPKVGWILRDKIGLIVDNYESNST